MGYPVAMMARAIDDNPTECINNAKSYLHSTWAIWRWTEEYEGTDGDV